MSILKDGYKDTEIGVIPDEWKVKSLSRIGSFSKGKGISKNEVIEDGIPCMRYAEIYTKYDIVLKNIKSFIDEKSALNSKKLHNGDILFAGSGETLDDIGKSVAFIDDFEAYVGGDTVILSPSIGYNSLFMAYQLNSTLVRLQLRKLGQGSSVVHIYSSGLEKLKVPFPPLKEQEKIADILSTADERIDAIAIQIDRAETLKKGLLQKLLSEGLGHSEFKDSELGKIPVGWEVVELKSIIKDMIGGVSVNSEDRQKSEEEYGILKTSAIQNGSFLPHKHKTILNTEMSRATTNPLADHIIFSRMNTPALVGQSGYVEQTIKDLFLPDRLWQLDVKDRDIVFVKWLSFILVSSDTFNMIKKSATGTSNSMKNISKPSLLKIKIPLPPLEEQKQIADILSTSDEKLEVLRAKKQMYETLKKGLLQKLLSGEVRV